MYFRIIILSCFLNSVISQDTGPSLMNDANPEMTPNTISSVNSLPCEEENFYVNLLSKLTDILLHSLHNDVSKTDMFNNIFELISNKLNVIPEKGRNIALAQQLKSLQNQIEIENKDILRTNDRLMNGEPTEKEKIVFKYDLPNLNELKCKEKFIKLIKVAHDSYISAARHPQCEDLEQPLRTYYDHDIVNPIVVTEGNVNPSGNEIYQLEFHNYLQPDSSNIRYRNNADAVLSLLQNYRPGNTIQLPEDLKIKNNFPDKFSKPIEINNQSSGINNLREPEATHKNAKISLEVIQSNPNEKVVNVPSKVEVELFKTIAKFTKQNSSESFSDLRELPRTLPKTLQDSSNPNFGNVLQLEPTHQMPNAPVLTETVLYHEVERLLPETPQNNLNPSFVNYSEISKPIAEISNQSPGATANNFRDTDVNIELAEKIAVLLQNDVKQNLVNIPSYSQPDLQSDSNQLNNLLITNKLYEVENPDTKIMLPQLPSQDLLPSVPLEQNNMNLWQQGMITEILPRFDNIAQPVLNDLTRSNPEPILPNNIQNWGANYPNAYNPPLVPSDDDTNSPSQLRSNRFLNLFPVQTESSTVQDAKQNALLHHITHSSYHTQEHKIFGNPTHSHTDNSGSNNLTDLLKRVLELLDNPQESSKAPSGNEDLKWTQYVQYGKQILLYINQLLSNQNSSWEVDLLRLKELLYLLHTANNGIVKPNEQDIYKTVADYEIAYFTFLLSQKYANGNFNNEVTDKYFELVITKKLEMLQSIFLKIVNGLENDELLSALIGILKRLQDAPIDENEVWDLSVKLLIQFVKVSPSRPLDPLVPQSDAKDKFNKLQYIHYCKEILILINQLLSKLPDQNSRWEDDLRRLKILLYHLYEASKQIVRPNEREIFRQVANREIAYFIYLLYQKYQPKAKVQDYLTEKYFELNMPERLDVLKDIIRNIRNDELQHPVFPNGRELISFLDIFNRIQSLNHDNGSLWQNWEQLFPPVKNPPNENSSNLPETTHSPGNCKEILRQTNLLLRHIPNQFTTWENDLNKLKELLTLLQNENQETIKLNEVEIFNRVTEYEIAYFSYLLYKKYQPSNSNYFNEVPNKYCDLNLPAKLEMLQTLFTQIVKYEMNELNQNPNGNRKLILELMKILLKIQDGHYDPREIWDLWINLIPKDSIPKSQEAIYSPTKAPPDIFTISDDLFTTTKRPDINNIFNIPHGSDSVFPTVRPTLPPYYYGPQPGALYPPQPNNIYLPTGGIFPPAGNKFPPFDGIFRPPESKFPQSDSIFRPPGGIYPHSGGIFPQSTVNCPHQYQSFIVPSYYTLWYIPSCLLSGQHAAANIPFNQFRYSSVSQPTNPNFSQQPISSLPQPQFTNPNMLFDRTYSPQYLLRYICPLLKRKPIQSYLYYQYIRFCESLNSFGPIQPNQPKVSVVPSKGNEGFNLFGPNFADRYKNVQLAQEVNKFQNEQLKESLLLNNLKEKLINEGYQSQVSSPSFKAFNAQPGNSAYDLSVGANNLYKLNAQPLKPDIIEVTSLLKGYGQSPYGQYYVKYRLPFDVFVANYRNLLLKEPFLRTNTDRFAKELLEKANITLVSPALRKIPKVEMARLLARLGSYVDGKPIQDNLNGTKAALRQGNDVAVLKEAQDIIDALEKAVNNNSVALPTPELYVYGKTVKTETRRRNNDVDSFGGENVTEDLKSQTDDPLVSETDVPKTDAETMSPDYDEGKHNDRGVDLFSNIGTEVNLSVSAPIISPDYDNKEAKDSGAASLDFKLNSLKNNNPTVNNPDLEDREHKNLGVTLLNQLSAEVQSVRNNISAQNSTDKTTYKTETLNTTNMVETTVTEANRNTTQYLGTV